MSLFQFFTAMEKYSLEILFLALLVCVLTSFVKKHIFHYKLKKLITFVPFIIAFIIYCAYAFVFLKITDFFTTQSFNYSFQIGGVSTIYYVFYEQLIRGKKVIAQESIGVMTTQGLLQEIVEPTFLIDTAKAIHDSVNKNLNDFNLCLALVTDYLQGKLKTGITNSEIIATAKIIISTLKSLKT